MEQVEPGGVMIYISAKLEHTEIDTLIDDDVRFIVTKCIIQGQTFLIVNAYPPNNEKTHCSFMQNLRGKIDEINCVEIQFYKLGADWNFVEDLTLDRKGGNPKLWKESCKIMKEIKETYDLCDIWRIKHEKVQKFTWWNLTKGFFSRLDRFYVSDSLQTSIEKAEILPKILSDHEGIIIQIKQNETPTGPGMNNLL